MANKFLDIQNNKILLTLTIFYILSILLIIYFNQFSWMQYKGDDKTAVNEILDDEEDKKRSTRSRAWNLFIKNKLFFYLIFAGFGFISLVLAWLHNVNIYHSPNDTSYINAIPNEYFQMLFKVVLGFSIIIGLIAMTFYFLSYTPKSLTLIISLINILIAAGSVALFFEKLPKKSSALLLGLLTFIIFSFINGPIFGLVFGIIGGFIGLFLGKSSPKTGKKSPLSEFIRAVVTYLPCLFINFALYLKKQFNLTTRTTTIIILLELLLIGLRFFIPFIYKLLRKYLMPQGNVLVSSPVSLHELTSLGVFMSDKQIKDRDFSEKVFMNYNYALSSWIWIIPESYSTSSAYTEETELLNLNNQVKVLFNKGLIEFWAETTANTPKMQKMIKLYTLKDFEYQKWNNFIINYYGGTLDIFVNRKLVSSTPNITPLTDFQNATAGMVDGVYGGIKDVVYFKKTLNQREIDVINNF